MSDSAENLYTQESKDYVATIADKNLRDSVLYHMRLSNNMSEDRDAFEQKCNRLEQQVVDLKAEASAPKQAQEAFEVIKQEMINDNPSEPGSFAHSWHCNIAMMCYDAYMAEYQDVADMVHEDALKIGNDAASRFMKLLFGVETKQ